LEGCWCAVRSAVDEKKTREDISSENQKKLLSFFLFIRVVLLLRLFFLSVRFVEWPLVRVRVPFRIPQRFPFVVSLVSFIRCMYLCVLLRLIWFFLFLSFFGGGSFYGVPWQRIVPHTNIYKRGHSFWRKFERKKNKIKRGTHNNRHTSTQPTRLQKTEWTYCALSPLAPRLWRLYPV
jgi:hypothetical protein